jgi:hypothetical protein
LSRVWAARTAAGPAAVEPTRQRPNHTRPQSQPQPPPHPNSHPTPTPSPNCNLKPQNPNPNPTSITELDGDGNALSDTAVLPYKNTTAIVRDLTPGSTYQVGGGLRVERRRGGGVRRARSACRRGAAGRAGPALPCRGPVCIRSKLAPHFNLNPFSNLNAPSNRPPQTPIILPKTPQTLPTPPADRPVVFHRLRRRRLSGHHLHRPHRLRHPRGGPAVRPRQPPGPGGGQRGPGEALGRARGGWQGRPGFNAPPERGRRPGAPRRTRRALKRGPRSRKGGRGAPAPTPSSQPQPHPPPRAAAVLPITPHPKAAPPFPKQP